MSDKTPIGLGRGKTLGLGLGGAKRHRVKKRDNIKGITKPAIKRLARRGGVKRISNSCYQLTRTIVRAFLERIVKNAVLVSECANRKTVSAKDAVYALKKSGHTIYGVANAN